MADAKEILFKHLDLYVINYDSHYIDDGDRAFDAIVDAMEEFADKKAGMQLCKCECPLVRTSEKAGEYCGACGKDII